MNEPKTYPRFNLGQRVEHILLIVSFMTLVITGLPQKYVGATWAETMIAWMGGIEIVRVIHRLAAVVFILETIYHIVVVAYKVYVQRVRMTMLPTVKDVKDGVQSLAYNFGLAKTRPKMDRYTFDEKMEYWSLIWGSVVMILTGFMLWNPIAVTQWLPGQFVPAAKSAHGNEALLAFLAILVWHTYHVHLRTFNKSMFTGRMTEAEMAHEHPLELERIKAGEAGSVVPQPVYRRRRSIFIPVAALASIVMVIGVYYFLTFEQTAITTIQPVSTVQAFSPQTPTPLPTLAPTPTSVPTQPGAVVVLAWEGDIGPLFRQRCGACHGNLGNYSVETYEATIQGGPPGGAIRPGDPAESPLVAQQSAGAHPGLFSASELEMVVDWIEAGAPER
jgi:cytochrome b subunit of formate dehydrogenase